MQVITIPEATPSLNVVLRKFRNLHARKKEQERWDWMVRAAWRKTETLSECEIIITRFASRLLDWDNMGGGLKFLMDGLVHNGVIADDNPVVVRRAHLEQVKTPIKDAHTVVVISPR